MKLRIEKLAPTATPQPDLCGLAFTIDVPEIPASVQTWQDFLNWLQENPDFIALIIQAILALLGGIAPPPNPPKR